MKLKNALIPAGLIGLGMMLGSAHAAFASPAVEETKVAAVVVDDKALETRIEAAMKKDTTLTNQDVDVDVDKGVVTLTGSVRSETRKTRAGQLAKVQGVTRVDNKLKIDANAGKGTTAKVEQTTKAAGHEVAHDAKVVGEKTVDAAKATGGAVDSGWITTKISSDFVDEALLKGSNINVDTTDHVVTLKGTVTSAAGSDRAAVIARRTDGVKSVVNQLVISAAK
jgi:hyperosmotically inducible periplasmic protein